MTCSRSNNDYIVHISTNHLFTKSYSPLKKSLMSSFLSSSSASPLQNNEDNENLRAPQTFISCMKIWQFLFECHCEKPRLPSSYIILQEEKKNRNGSGEIEEMDGVGCVYVDTGIYRDELWLLIVFIGFEDGNGVVTGAAQLSILGIWLGEALWVVFGCFPSVFPYMARPLHCCFHGILWLRPSMACYSRSNLFAFSLGQLSILLLACNLVQSMWMLIYPKTLIKIILYPSQNTRISKVFNFLI